MDVTCVPLSFLVSPYAKISFRLSISLQLHPLTLTLGNSGKGGEHVCGLGIPAHFLLSHLHLQDHPTSQSTERLFYSPHVEQ